MAEGDGAPIHVGALPQRHGVAATVLHAPGNGDGGKRLVHLEEVDVLDAEPSPIESFGCRRDGTGEHHHRIDSRHGEGAETRLRRQAQLVEEDLIPDDVTIFWGLAKRLGLTLTALLGGLITFAIYFALTAFALAVTFAVPATWPARVSPTPAGWAAKPTPTRSS